MKENNISQPSLGQVAFETFCRCHKVNGQWSGTIRRTKDIWNKISDAIIVEHSRRCATSLNHVLPLMKLESIGRILFEKYAENNGFNWKWDQISDEDKFIWNAAGRSVIKYFSRICINGDLNLDSKTKTKQKNK